MDTSIEAWESAWAQIAAGEGYELAKKVDWKLDYEKPGHEAATLSEEFRVETSVFKLITVWFFVWIFMNVRVHVLICVNHVKGGDLSDESVGHESIWWVLKAFIQS